MRSRSWINIILLVAVAIVATAIFMVRDSGHLSPAPVTNLDPSTVTTFEVRYADDRPALRLEGGETGWRIVEPVQREARSARVVRIISFLNARLDSCYAETEERLAEFGLDSPRLTLVAGDVTVDFGDRSPDGRRYVGSGERLCLVDDVAYPLLDQGLAGVASMRLVAHDAQPVEIRTPAAMAVDEDAEGQWKFEEGEGAGQRWAARWRAASATDFDLDPPEQDQGTVRIAFHDGHTLRWRIADGAGGERSLVLVPEGADYGLELAVDEAAGLITPPQEVEDGLD